MTLKLRLRIFKHLNLDLSNFRFAVWHIFFKAFALYLKGRVLMMCPKKYCKSAVLCVCNLWILLMSFRYASLFVWGWIYFFKFVFIFYGISAPQHFFCSGWLSCSLDVLQQLHVVCFMLFTFLHIMTGSSGFPQNRYMIFSSLLTLHLP